MTPSDIWNHGITQDSFTGDYYLWKATIQWIEFSQLVNMQEMPLLQHECTHMAEWINPTVERSISDKGQLRIVMLKKMLDGQNAQTYDFYQVLCSL